jgi:hypothetical protein
LLPEQFSTATEKAALYSISKQPLKAPWRWLALGAQPSITTV